MAEQKKPIIFIDANIYLNMYAPTSIHMLALAPVLLSDDVHVFVTRQIVDEVERNKVKVFVKPAMDAMSAFKAAHLPPLHEGADGDFADKAKARLKKFQTDAIKLAASIRDGTDNVSKLLAPIFSQAKVPEPEEVERARTRREMGNPPGKIDDPLGDQVTWEQLLAFSQPGQDIWIVTNDDDYWDRDKRGVFQLNARLQRELNEKIKNGNIYCFTDLSEALTDIRKKLGTLAKLPEKEELEEIKREEVTAAANTAVTTANAVSYVTQVFSPIPSGCPACGSTSVSVMATGDINKPLFHCMACNREWYRNY